MSIHGPSLVEITRCPSCEQAPAWWWSWRGHCRRCSSNEGQSAFQPVDVDKVLAYFEGDLVKALDFLAKCK